MTGIDLEVQRRRVSFLVSFPLEPYPQQGNTRIKGTPEAVRKASAEANEAPRAIDAPDVGGVVGLKGMDSETPK